jgi:hypothetical protein
MLLADHLAGTDHPFLYARVVGIYHVNVIFAPGSGVIDYTPHRLHFLWVRWFQYHDAKSKSWADCHLDRVSFPPMAHPDSFGFLDPGDVLQGCHIILT